MSFLFEALTREECIEIRVEDRAEKLAEKLAEEKAVKLAEEKVKEAEKELRVEERLKIAKGLKESNIPIDIIAKSTELSEDRIKEL